jgi:hypothetical protein
VNNAKEYISEALDDIALGKYGIFYDDLHKSLQEVVFALATREWEDYYSGYIDYIYQQ